MEKADKEYIDKQINALVGCLDSAKRVIKQLNDRVSKLESRVSGFDEVGHEE